MSHLAYPFQRLESWVFHSLPTLLPMIHIRTAARAIIIENHKLLTIKMRDTSGTFNILPGGGQKHGETLHQALTREVQEEIGVPILIGEFAFIREYIGKNHAFRNSHANFHQVECIFKCILETHEGIGTGTELDKKQIGLEWIPLNKIEQSRLLPEAIKSFFTSSGFFPQKSYLGDTN